MWQLLEYAAWGVSAVLLLMMLADAIRLNRDFDEDFLLSSQEGVDELDEFGAHGGISGGREG